MANSAVLDLVINLKDDASAGLGRLTGVLGGIGTAALAGTAVAGAAVAGLAAKGIADFTSFQGKMNEVFTLLPGISQDAMADMTGQVKDFAKDFGVLPERVIPALYQSLSAGVPPDNVFAFLETAQKAAAGGVTELETAVDGISSVVNAYGSDVLSATQASDLMFTAVRLGKTDFTQLSQSLFNVTPTASALGVSFGDVTAALAAMTAQGVPTSVATTQLRQLFVELSKEGTNTSKTFEEIAGKSFKEFIASGGNVQGALQLLEQHAGATGVGINDLFGSVEAGGAALALTGKGTEAFSTALDGMAQSAGATDAAFETMQSGLGASFAKIQATFAVFFVEVGERLAPLVARAADLLGVVLPRALDVVGAAFDAVVPIVEGLFDAFAIGKLDSLYDALYRTLGPDIAAIITGALGAVIQIVKSLRGETADAGANISATWQRVQDMVTRIMTALGHFLRATFHVISTFWRAHGEEIMAFAGQTWNTVSEIVTTAAAIIRTVIAAVTRFINEHSEEIQLVLSAAWLVISNVIRGALALIEGLLKATLAILRGDWQGAWTAIQEMSERFVLAIVGVITGFLNLIAGLFGATMNEIWDLWKSNFDKIDQWLTSSVTQWRDAGRNLIMGLVDGVASGVGALQDAVANAAQGALDRAKSLLGISSPSQVFRDQVGMQIARGMAEGIAGGSRMVQGAAGDLAGSALAGGATTYNYHLTYNAASATAPEDDVRRALRTQALLGGAV